MLSLRCKKERCLRKAKKGDDMCPFHIKNSYEDDCPICLERDTDSWVNLGGCRHCIHKKCLLQFKKMECPLCRTPMILPEEIRSEIEKNVENEEDVDLFTRNLFEIIFGPFEAELGDILTIVTFSMEN